MARRYSDVERANLAWFEKDTTAASLKKIGIRKGEVRGLKKMLLDFNYPITAISGRNGNGKSTVIALAACAFHNARNGWKLPERSVPYYTFSDFFVQTRGEKPLDGVEVWYEILYNGWQPSTRLPSGEGLGWQASKKRRGGRWTDYEKRVDRPVAFLGVERVVPSVEKSVLRSYRRRFSTSERTGFEEAVCTAVSKVLGVSYDSFEFREHGKHRLPWVVRKKGAGYSGFNMGAGEKALFELFAIIYSAPRGALFLIDEIELGLHEKAQVALIRALGDICKERHIQVICTTHSSAILSSLPPEGRIHIESSSNVIHGVSAEYATGLMSGKNSSELIVYLEDAVAKALFDACLEGDLRSRVKSCVIGSHNAVLGSLVARFNDDSLGPAIGILDGDQRIAAPALFKRFVGLCESKSDSKEWIQDRLTFLPGDASPEVVVLSEIRKLDLDVLEDAFRYPASDVVEALDIALLESGHNHLSRFASAIHMDSDRTWQECCRLLVGQKPELFNSINDAIRARVNS